MDSLQLLFRMVHVLSAVVLAGGATFTLLALMPAAQDLPDEIHAGLKSRIADRWRKVVGVGILLLLISGFYNYLVVQIPQHKGDGGYHMLMGMKILLAFAAFFLASALSGRSKGLEFLRRDSKKWVTVLVSILVVVIALGSVLKVRGVPAAPETGVASSAVSAGSLDKPVDAR